jgi:hypothetical protein
MQRAKRRVLLTLYASAKLLIVKPRRPLEHRGSNQRPRCPLAPRLP